MTDTALAEDLPEPGYNWREQYSARLRAAMAFVAEADGQVRKDDVVSQARLVAPPTGEWERRTLSNGVERWETNFLWSTTALVKAGLMVKDGRGLWTATDDAEPFLVSHPDPLDFAEEANRRFRDWSAANKQLQQHAWLIRGSSVLGRNLVPSWLLDGFVSIAGAQLPEVNKETSEAELREFVLRAYDHLKLRQRKEREEEIVAFVVKMKPGDVVLTNNGADLFVGDVTSDWSWEPSDSGTSNLRRKVEWRNLDTPIDFNAIPAPLPVRLQTPKTLVDLTDELALIDRLTVAEMVEPDNELIGNDSSIDAAASVGMVKPAKLHERLGPVSEQLASSLFVEQAWLDEIVELLNEKRQIIFYGPPGTSKSYMAQEIANYFAPRSEGRTRLVQFHPSYTYEDFFEGFRPAEGATAGTLTFALRPGPFRRIVNQAIDNPQHAYFLIIDEINRANLAKVFGELYFLLEYRDKGVELLYSDEADFSLPKNVYIIATMNTADRSIALIDAAMRRRFAFVSLHPGDEPTSSLLRRWLAAERLPDTAARLLDLLNEAIDDPDFKVGPAYFMKSKDHSEQALSRVWRSTILPLLEEHFYGRWADNRSRFDFAKVWAKVNASVVDAVESPASAAAIPEALTPQPPSAELLRAEPMNTETP